MAPGFTLEFFADVFKHLRVLLLVYVLSSIGSWMLIMRSSTINTLGEDYVTVARARGLPGCYLIYQHRQGALVRVPVDWREERFFA